jgi:hypothetical protein
MTGKSTQTRFHSAREAKEFLASQIAEQAQRDKVQLSIIEQKMLYFSETDWTLSDMSMISQEFDRVYDQDQYEEKVTTLVRHAYKRALKGHRDDYENWRSAIRLLSREDHYGNDKARRLATALGPTQALGCRRVRCGSLGLFRFPKHLPTNSARSPF